MMMMAMEKWVMVVWCVFLLIHLDTPPALRMEAASVAHFIAFALSYFHYPLGCWLQCPKKANIRHILSKNFEENLLLSALRRRGRPKVKATQCNSSQTFFWHATCYSTALLSQALMAFGFYFAFWQSTSITVFEFAAFCK